MYTFKKEKNNFLTYKEIRDQVQSHIWLKAPHIWLKKRMGLFLSYILSTFRNRNASVLFNLSIYGLGAVGISTWFKYVRNWMTHVRMFVCYAMLRGEEDIMNICWELPRLYPLRPAHPPLYYSLTHLREPSGFGRSCIIVSSSTGVHF